MLTLQIKEKEIENLTPEEEFVRGTVGAKCQINFDEFWQSYNKYIVFKRVGYEPINFIVDTLENEIEIPYTILAESGEFKIGVFGTTETETLPTLYSKDIKILYGTDTHGTTPPTYIPSEIDQLRLSKQDKLTAGNGIKIENNVISSSGTIDYKLLENKPQINGVELLGNKSLTDLGIDIPTKTSELENDSGFIDDTAFEKYYTKTEVDEKTVVDQTYNKNSQNAQSGLATAEAVGVANDYTDKAIKSLKTYANNNFAPAIKNNVTGEHIAINDVSSIEHDLQIKLLSDTVTDFSAVNVSRCGKNIFDFESFANEIIEAGRNCEIVEFDGRRCFKIISTTTQFTRDLSRFKAFGIQFNYYNAGTYTTSFFSFKNIGGATTYIGGSTLNEWTTISYYYQFADKQIVEFRCYCESDEENPIYIDLDSFMIEESQAPTDYEPYNGQTATANADGSVDGLTSLSPNMTVVTDTDGVTIDMTYNADTKMYIDNKIAEISAAIVNNV